MLGLANQSSSVAASELARRWVPNCLIRWADDPVWRELLQQRKKSALRNPLSRLSRRIPERRNRRAKNMTSASLLA
jgi:hypothetical protein